MKRADISDPLRRSRKRTEAEMRTEMLSNGAHLLEFQRFHKECSAKQASAWLTVQRKGFLVLKETSCIVPHQYYRTKGLEGPSRIRGHIAALEAFVDPISDRTIDLGRNVDGWPLRLEVSHYCHNPLCCNPSHLGVEPRWRNWRRNYCIGCDCGQEPQCLARYHPYEWWIERLEAGELSIEQDVSQALKLIRGDSDQFEVRAIPHDSYRVEDIKSKNRRLRGKRKRKHEKQRERNDETSSSRRRRKKPRLD